MPDDETADLFPGLIAAVPPPLVAPTGKVIEVLHHAEQSLAAA